jgi:ribosomal protein S18 acetylase RimI-like enzyme
MEKMIVRILKASEISEIARIKLSAQKASMPYKKFVRTFEDECEYLRKVQERCVMVVALIDQEIVGFAAYGNGLLEQIFINPDSYNQGIGTALLEYAKNASTQLKASVDLKNENAIRFYESRGFIRKEKIAEANAVVYEWVRENVTVKHP